MTIPDHGGADPAPMTLHARLGEQSLTFRREFAAPAALVFRAHTDPELFGQWMGPRGTSCELATFNPVSGGSFDYTIASRFRFHGAYHEVSAPSRIVHTWEFAGDPGRPTLEILTFVDLPAGRCRLEGQSLYTSADHCTEMLTFDESGQGMDENFERLDELCARLADPPPVS